MALHGHLLQHHVARRASRSPSACWWTAPSSRSRTPTRSSSSGSTGGRQGDFHAVRLEALLEVGPVGLLLAARDRRGLPAHLHAGGPGGPALQAPGLDQEPGHGRSPPARRSPSTPRCACSSRGWTSSTSGRAALCWLVNQVTVGRYYPEEKHPISRVLFARLRARLPRSCCATRRRRSRAAVLIVATTVPVYLGLGHEFMPPLERGDAPLHADHAARHLGDRGEPPAPDAGPDPRSRSPRSSASSARPAAPRPPPIPRPSR